jgi:hypothetical protein
MLSNHNHRGSMGNNNIDGAKQPPPERKRVQHQHQWCQMTMTIKET